jgi:dienelactone hydrolase
MLGSFMKLFNRCIAFFICGLICIALIGCAASSRVSESPKAPKVITQEINYALDNTQLKGFLAYPSGVTKAPGVLVVHEWWGHNDYARKRARMLAELGYVAFALDMYGDGKVADHPKDANAFMMEVMGNAQLAKARFNQGLKILSDQTMVDKENLGAIGYCMGGNLVLGNGRSNPSLKAVVSFHGSLGGLTPVSKMTNTQFLVFNGAADPFVTADSIVKFKADMDSAQLQYEFIDYPGVAHSFTNPGATEIGAAYGLPLKYDANADADSWTKMQGFFKRILK